MLDYEHHSEPLLPRPMFLRRVARHGGVALSIVACMLAIGMAGYRFTEGMPWIDAYLNAAMILGGMGEVTPLEENGAKLFAGAYALFAGVVFIAVAGVLLAPAAHRLLHKIHLEQARSSGGGKRR